MSFSYKYDKKDIIIDQLQLNINADPGVGQQVSYIDGIDDVICVWFEKEIIGDAKTALDLVVSSFVPVPYSTSMVYDAIVGSIYNSAYQSIADAFDAGHTSIFVRDGLYMETRNIVMPNYGSITGESSGNVVIHFMGAGHGIIADGSSGVKEVSGKVSIERNSNLVVGIGTSFAKMVIEETFILLGTNHYKVVSIADDTHLTIEDTYRGKSLVDISPKLIKMLTGIKLEKLIVTGSTTCGVYLRGCRHFVVDSVSCKANSVNYQIVDCGDSGAHRLLSESGGSNGLNVVDCNSMVFNTVDVYNNDGDGISLSGSAESVLFIGCEASNNGGIGINNNAASKEVSFINCVVKSNTSHGVFIGPNNVGTMLNATSVNLNGECGIHAKGNYSSIVNIICSDNGSSGIHIACGDSCVASNIATNNQESGIKVSGSGNIVKGNVSHGNTVGVSIELGSVDNIVCYNNLKSNTTAVLDYGVGTDLSGNKI